MADSTVLYLFVCLLLLGYRLWTVSAVLLTFFQCDDSNV